MRLILQEEQQSCCAGFSDRDAANGQDSREDFAASHDKRIRAGWPDLPVSPEWEFNGFVVSIRCAVVCVSNHQKNYLLPFDLAPAFFMRRL